MVVLECAQLFAGVSSKEGRNQTKNDWIIWTRDTKNANCEETFKTYLTYTHCERMLRFLSLGVNRRTKKKQRTRSTIALSGQLNVQCLNISFIDDTWIFPFARITRSRFKNERDFLTWYRNKETIPFFYSLTLWEANWALCNDCTISINFENILMPKKENERPKEVPNNVERKKNWIETEGHRRWFIFL